MVRPPQAFLDAARDYVCVRITNLDGVDLELFRFDYDLTLAILFLHHDGTVLHRYGGRNAEDPLAWMSMPSLTKVMRKTVADYRAYAKDPKPKPHKRFTIDDYPPFARKRKTTKIDCVHCHMVHDARTSWLKEEKRFDPKRIWIWPLPDKIGLVMAREDQALVDKVLPDSPAKTIGIKQGDRIVQLADQHVLSVADIQWVLESAPFEATQIPISYRRGDALHKAQLKLTADWKRDSIEGFSWRASIWRFDPKPGFGGKDLSREEKRKLKIPVEQYAFRVQYLVTWGKNAFTGEQAKRAGIRKGDVVIAADGKTDFRSQAHFHAWVRLAHAKGDTLTIRLLRNRAPRTIKLKLL